MINLFQSTGFFLYPQEVSENQRFFDVFRVIERAVAWNELNLEAPTPQNGQTHSQNGQTHSQNGHSQV